MTISLFDQSGWIALITGSTQALGEVTARVLVELYAHVIISSQKEKACNKIMDASRNDGLSAEDLAGNIGHQDAINDACHDIAKTHGRLDILVNNAVLSPWHTIEETDRPLILKALETITAGYW